jgi:uncharacterized protein
VDLYLCGDTHGGQVSLPLWGPLVVIGRQGRRYTKGLYRSEEGGGHVFVSSGIGMEDTLPVRVGVRPVITVIDLLPLAEGAAQGR